jgi:hypothetical protein
MRTASRAAVMRENFFMWGSPFRGNKGVLLHYTIFLRKTQYDFVFLFSFSMKFHNKGGHPPHLISHFAFCVVKLPDRPQWTKRKPDAIA